MGTPCVNLLILSFFTLLSNVRNNHSDRSETAFIWENFENLLILTSPIDAADNVHSASGCVLLCLENTQCVSVFYRASQKRCQLHDVLFLSPEDGVEENGTVYYSLTSDSCPVTYIHNRYRGMCYQPHLNKILYTAGRSDCQSRAQHFLVIDSQEKQDHVKEQITSSSGGAKTSWYIDGSDAIEEGQWVYHDGRPVTFFAWEDGYPKNLSGNHYLAMEIKSGTFLWKDKRADQKFYFCQIDI